MSAKFVDALMGYDYYLGERGEATIDDVNHYLEVHGRQPIQPRTYGHYRKLLAHGFRSYIPINQFDVFQALGKLQMAADRRRYHRDSSQVSAEISRDQENWIGAVVVNKSLVGLGVTIPGDFSAFKGELLWVRMDGYRDIPTITVWRRHEKDGSITNLGLRGFEFLAAHRLTREDYEYSRLGGLIEVSRKEDGVLGWEQIYRISEKTNELLDGVSDLLYSLDSVLEREIQVARPLLASIRFGSPGALQIKVDFGVAELITALTEKIQYWGLDRERLKQENRKRELENVNLGIDVLRNAINARNEALDAGMTEDAISAILEPVRKIFGCRKLPRQLFREGTPERGVLTHRVLPVLTELILGDDSEFELNTSVVGEISPKVHAPERPSRRRRPKIP